RRRYEPAGTDFSAIRNAGDNKGLRVNNLTNFGVPLRAAPKSKIPTSQIPTWPAPPVPLRGTTGGTEVGNWDFRPRSVGFAIDQVISARSLTVMYPQSPLWSGS